MKLRKRGNTWHVDITLSKTKRIRQSLKTKDKALALILAKEIALKASPHTHFKRITIEQFSTEYNVWADQHKDPATRKEEKRVLRDFGEPVKYLDEITKKHADEFVTRRLGEVAISTVKGNVTLLRVMFNTAIRWGYAKDNPFVGVPFPLEEQKPNRILEREEIISVIESANKHTPKYAPIIEFLLWTGLRRSEALKLHRDKIHLDKRFLELIGKRKRFRVLPLIDRAIEILVPRMDKEYPFGEYKRVDVSRQFKRAAEKAGLPDLKLKYLRGTFEYYAIELGALSEAIANKITGHSMKISRENYLGVPMHEVLGKLNKLGELRHKSVTKVAEVPEKK